MDEPLRFKRAALIVADLDRSLAVYRDAIGFRLESVKTSQPDSYSYDIFDIPRASRLRMAALDGAEDQTRTLALIEVTPPQPKGARSAATVVFVSDVDAVVQRLRALDGVQVLAERTLATHDGRVGREVGVIDPDGHAIVLYNV